MAAYILGQIDVTDVEVFKRYSEQVHSTVQQYGGRYLVAEGKSKNWRGSFRAVVW